MLKSTKPLLQTISIDDKTAKQIYNLLIAFNKSKHKVYFINKEIHKELYYISGINNTIWFKDDTFIDLNNPEHIKQFKEIGYYI